MSQLDKKIATEIKEIANGHADTLPVMSGKVVAGSVDETAATCTVLLSANDESAPTKGILLNAVTENANGVLIIPKDESHVWVAEIDKGKWGIIKTSDVKKVIIKISGTKELVVESGKAVFNGGSNGGLCITPTLKTELNKTKALLQHLIAVINGSPVPEAGSGGPSGLQAALKAAILSDTLGDFSNIENSNVKH